MTLFSRPALAAVCALIPLAASAADVRTLDAAQVAARPLARSAASDAKSTAVAQRRAPATSPIEFAIRARRAADGSTELVCEQQPNPAARATGIGGTERQR